MNRVYNFSAGPACLHEEVITGAKDSIQNFQENGIGLLEMSHRSRPVVEPVSYTHLTLPTILLV